ncbi:MAG: hypothetical protein GXY44_01015 [Phycisphaerales bacterium]|nr:hypothetical protein [Phycisphaerales bacterium]
MGYDVEFLQIPVPPGLSFPVVAETAQSLRHNAISFDDVECLRTELHNIKGCRPGPDQTVDFFGRGLNYARLTISRNRIHVENNASVPELLKIYRQLTEKYPTLVILDLQSHQLHDADSFSKWWAKPL